MIERRQAPKTEPKSVEDPTKDGKGIEDGSKPEKGLIKDGKGIEDGVKTGEWFDIRRKRDRTWGQNRRRV